MASWQQKRIYNQLWMENLMPNVNGQKYAYTKAGKAAATAAAVKIASNKKKKPKKGMA